MKTVHLNNRQLRAAGAEHVYLCDRCEWTTDGLNTYLAHRCDPGRRALVLYQRRTGAKQPTSPYIT